MKVGEEELFGAYAAVKWTMAQDEAGLAALHEQQADYIIEKLGLLPNVSAHKVTAHGVEVHFDERLTGMSYGAANDCFQHNEPGILLGGIMPGSLRLTTSMLQPGDGQIIADQFRRFFVQQCGWELTGSECRGAR